MESLDGRFAFGVEARFGPLLCRLRFRPLHEVNVYRLSQANGQTLLTNVALQQVLLYLRSAFRLQSPTNIKL
jgi:hypothetical protein